MELLARNGFPVVSFRRAGTVEEATAAARAIGFPVAVKTNSLDVTHKSDVGGVILNVTDEAGVREALRTVAEIARRIGARDGGVLVSAMAPPGLEVVVGVTRDLQFGHAVMFGLGGVLVEILGDVAFRIVPFTEKDAAEMIADIRGAPVLRGGRSGDPADVAGLRQLPVQISALVIQHPEIAGIDLHPVILHQEGLPILETRGAPGDRYP